MKIGLLVLRNLLAVAGGYLFGEFVCRSEYSMYLQDMEAGNSDAWMHAFMIASVPLLLGIAAGSLLALTDRYPIELWGFAIASFLVSINYLTLCGVKVEEVLSLQLAMFPLGLAIGWSSEFLKVITLRKLEKD